ncbi:hypothetical protein HY468_04465 [Candidatus Roizmanbacteria bacterium]|nr:hypothetical protein [Candidatus Roizmanbacteria bacterium]
MTTSLQDQYRVGLGRPFLDRARNIFLVITVLFIGISVSVVYAGIQSGELEKKFVNPVKETIVEIIQSLTTSSISDVPSVPESSSFIATSSSEIRVDINSEIHTTVPGSQKQSQYGYAYPSVTPYPTIDYQKQFEEWRSQYEEQNSNWNNEMQKQSQQSLEEFKKQSKQSLEEFKQLGEKCAQEFHDNAGSYTSSECKTMVQ